jgi:MFS transporter, MHS family, shikimate and dehydroshikimate transport protein
METSLQQRSSSLRVAVATAIGTTIEAYDFYIYGFAAALTFPTLFFPKSDPFFGQIASYGIFWVGFLGKPLGGIVFGHFGDRVGRKAMLVITLLIMGLATFCVGVLPTYAQIGVLAPVLLVVLRLAQGVALGGEWGGAVLMAVEHARMRSKGLLSSAPQLGIPMGLIVASVVLAVVSARFGSSGNADLAGIAWRIPFLLSIVLVAIGVAVRLSIDETPAFEQLRARSGIIPTPVLTALRTSWRAVLLSGGAFIALSAGFYLVTTQILSYGAGPQSILKLDPRVFFIANLVGSTLGVVATPFGGWLSDRIGRRPVYLIGIMVILIVAFPIYALIDTKDPRLIALAICMFTLPASVAYGSLAAMFSELFSANVRYSGVSLGYHFAALLGGGIAPLVATLLLRFSGGMSWVLSLYLATMAAISLISIVSIPETRQVDLYA